MYLRFINLRIIIELCGSIVVYWCGLWNYDQYRIWPFGFGPHHLPRGCHVVCHVAAMSFAPWLPRRLPHGCHVVCHMAATSSANALPMSSMSDVAS
jgi:hypothetical protein